MTERYRLSLKENFIILHKTYRVLQDKMLSSQESTRKYIKCSRDGNIALDVW